jgi:hypothetical protein
VDPCQEGKDVLVCLRGEGRKVQFAYGIGKLGPVFGETEPFGQGGDDFILELVDLSGLHD